MPHSIFEGLCTEFIPRELFQERMDATGKEVLNSEMRGIFALPIMEYTLSFIKGDQLYSISESCVTLSFKSVVEETVGIFGKDYFRNQMRLIDNEYYQLMRIVVLKAESGHLIIRIGSGRTALLVG